MTDNASTDATSDGNQDSAGAGNLGVPGDGGGAGTQADSESGDAFASERVKYQSTIRELQGAKDRETARAASLERQLAVGSTSSTDSSDAPVGLTLADLRRVRELDRMSVTLKDEFPEADPSLFNDADPLDFESPEAYRLQVSRSHEARSAAKNAMKAEVEAELRAAYAERYGPLGDEAPEGVGETDAVTGDPTPAQLAAMSLKEQVAFDTENPGVIDRVLAKNNPGGLMTSGGGV